MLDNRDPARWRVDQGHVLDLLQAMPDRSIQCCATSPPYYALRDYKLPDSEWGDGWGGCLGLEPNPEMYIAHLVEVFSEVKRVLRDDGLLWVVMGDSYNNRSVARPSSHQGGLGFDNESISRSWADGTKLGLTRLSLSHGGMKEKDLIGIPWMLAFALRSSGWYLRSDVIWAKKNGMPGSQKDRCTSSHEYVFMFAKSRRYYYDDVAIREPDQGKDHNHRNVLDGQPSLEPTNGLMTAHQGIRTENGRNGTGRTKRDVWWLPVQPFPDAHFAVFPLKLIEPMVLAGSANQACSICGAPWKRIVERGKMEWYEGPKRESRIESAIEGTSLSRTHLSGTMTKAPTTTTTTTTGWEPTCDHDDGEGRSVVLDPFAGAGTTGIVALKYGRHFIGIDLSEKYVEMARNRIAKHAPINSVPDNGQLLQQPSYGVHCPA